MKPGPLRGDVVDVRTVGSMVRIKVNAAGWRKAVPGQFAMVRPSDSRCFLPRAFSVHSEGLPAAPGAPSPVSFLVSPVGVGTRELTALVPGDQVSLLGPVGRGFDLAALGGGSVDDDRAGGRLLVVAGGVGAAPFVLLLDDLAAAARGDRARAGSALPSEVVLLFGFRDEPQAAVVDLFTPSVQDLRAAGIAARVEVICEDGSLGRAGLVTAILGEEVRAGDRVAACGAHAMCRAVWDVCLEAGVPDVWFSLEAGMACGVGSCQGCVVPLADGGLARVCREGPVFSGRDAFGDVGSPCLPRDGVRP